TNNSAGGVGGGLNNAADGGFNTATLTVSGSTFTGNSSEEGGGIYIEPFSGRVTVIDSIFASNDVDDEGGAIDNGATLTVIGSTFTENTAGSDGGGLGTESTGTTTVIGSTFTHNSASVGGGMNNDGRLTVSDCTFTGNSANIGGGLFNT